MSVLGHRLAAELLAVDDEFHFVAVAVCPEFDGLALVALQVPVGEDMERRFVGPPGFQIPRLVFPEAAIVEDAEFGVVGREDKGIGFAAIVEARPVEESGSPGTVGIELPAALDDVLHVVMGGVAIHRYHASGIVGRVEVPASSATARGFFRTYDLPVRMGLLAVIDIVLDDIVEAHDVEALDEFGASRIRHRAGTGGVIELCIFAHRLGQTGALDGVLQSPLLVAVAPEDDRRMVPVALDHPLQQSQVLLVDAHQAVLVDDEDALTVADIEQGGRHGIM